MDLLVSHPCGRFRSARHDIVAILKRFGDERPQIRRTAVDGIAWVNTCLDNRDVTHRCRELFRHHPDAFENAIKWTPVDYWRDTSLEDIRKLMKRKYALRSPKTKPGA